MSIKLWVESQRKRSDTVGKVCRAVLADEFINWHSSNMEVMQQISMMRRSAGIHERAMNRFFNELKEAL